MSPSRYRKRIRVQPGRVVTLQKGSPAARLACREDHDAGDLPGTIPTRMTYSARWPRDVVLNPR